MVVNSLTGEPVRYAMVSLTGAVDARDASSESKPSQPIVKNIQAGVAGEFQFNALPEAIYNIQAQKPGFTLDFAGGRDPVGAIRLTNSVSGIQIKLDPLGVLEGRVVDQDGEPLPGVHIVALQTRVNDGLRETNQVRSVATDDRGVYRLWNLQPGKYYLKAAGKSGATYRYVGDTAPYYSSWQSFAPVYYGGGKTFEGATPLQIDAGYKGSADFQLKLEPAFRIQGTLTNPPSGQVTFELLQGNGDVITSRASLNTSTGRFEVLDVSSGSYTLRATYSNEMRGEMPVVVSGSDLKGVTLSLAPAVDVPFQTTVVGGAASRRAVIDQFLGRIPQGRSGDREVPESAFRTDCQPSLDTEGSGTHKQFVNGKSKSLDAGGISSIRDVLPGNYNVRLNCQFGFPISATFAGQDLLSNPHISIQPGSTPGPIEISVQAGGGKLTGMVKTDSSSQILTLLLIPDVNASTSTQRIMAFRSPAGEYSLNAPFLAPGDYTVYAFEKGEEIEYRDPAFLRKLSGGVTAHIDVGKEAQVTITKVIQ